MKTKLKALGEIMNNTYYLISPVIFSKLFLFTMIITNQKGIMIFLASLFLIIICYSTALYRVLTLFNSKTKGGTYNAKNKSR